MDFADFIKLIGAVSGMAIALIGVGRMILNHYFKMERDLAKSKQELHEKTLVGIKHVVNDLRKVTESHTQKMTEFQIALEKSYFRYDAQTDSIKTLTENFKEFGKEFKSDMSIIRSVVMKLGQELIMIKGTKPPK